VSRRSMVTAEATSKGLSLSAQGCSTRLAWERVGEISRNPDRVASSACSQHNGPTFFAPYHSSRLRSQPDLKSARLSACAKQAHANPVGIACYENRSHQTGHLTPLLSERLAFECYTHSIPTGLAS
jgi:hypothetical protein